MKPGLRWGTHGIFCWERKGFRKRSLAAAALPEAVGEEVGETDEALVGGGGGGKAVVCAEVEDERGADSIAAGEEQSDGVGAGDLGAVAVGGDGRLGEMPKLAGNGEGFVDLAGEGDGLTILCAAVAGAVILRVEDEVGVVVDAEIGAAGKEEDALGKAADIEVGSSAGTDAAVVAEGEGGDFGTAFFLVVEQDLSAEDKVAGIAGMECGLIGGVGVGLVGGLDHDVMIEGELCGLYDGKLIGDSGGVCGLQEALFKLKIAGRRDVCGIGDGGAGRVSGGGV